MFRPIRMFQLGTLLCLVAGCATGGTPHNQDGAHPGTAPAAPAAQPGPVPPATTGTAPATLPPLPQPPIVPPPISAGESTPGPMGFTQDNGKLNPDIQAYAAEVARTRNIPQQTVEALLREARYDETVARLMSPAKTRVRRSWSSYGSRVVEPVRIKAGLSFLEAHQQQLARTVHAYGVPASIIVAIIGVETIY